MNGGFPRRVVVLDAHESLPYDPADWDDTLVAVTGGEIELENTDGQRQRFGHGALLCFAGLPVRMLHTVGTQPVVLVAVRRR